jgi:hypothetical protein
MEGYGVRCERQQDGRYAIVRGGLFPRFPEVGEVAAVIVWVGLVYALLFFFVLSRRVLNRAS